MNRPAEWNTHAKLIQTLSRVSCVPWLHITLTCEQLEKIIVVEFHQIADDSINRDIKIN